MSDITCGVTPAGNPGPEGCKVRKRMAKDDTRLGQMGFDAKARASCNILVAESGGKIVGAASGVVPLAGDTAMLGLVVTSDWPVFDALLTAHVSEAIELGFTYGEARVPTAATHIIEYLRSRFGLEPEPYGTCEGNVMAWRYVVGLRQFLEQLKAVG